MELQVAWYFESFAVVLREWLQMTKNYVEKQENYKDDPVKQPERGIRLESLADLRLLSGDPLDVMTKVRKPIIDGDVVFSR